MTRARRMTAWAWNAVRVTLGFLFLLAAAGKLRDPIKFMGGMDQYQLVHGWTLPLGATLLPGVELLGALLLLLGVMTRPAALLVSGQLLLFIGAMGSALYRKIELDCSCFDLMGADPSLMALAPALRDLALTLLLLAFHFLSTEPARTPRPRLWRALLTVALFLWMANSLLAAGSPAWQPALRWLLAAAAAAWLVLDIGVGQGWRGIRWGRALGEALLVGAPAWLILHLLGNGAATLGWGTIFRDVAMCLPALWLAVRVRPEHA